MSGDKFIIVTTINPPGKAVHDLAKWEGWNLIVIGDCNTPSQWACPGATYLDLEAQKGLFPALSDEIGANTYTRKMIGYAYAIQAGAAAIFETDDDNIPLPHAQETIEAMIAADNRVYFERRRSTKRWLNAYSLFASARIWPRGFPLESVRDADAEIKRGTGSNPWAVMQFLCDEDPDVDAIYRMTAGAPVYFATRKMFVLDEGSFCPFNSQATLWLPEAFPWMFLPICVSDRVTDILRGYIATACLWSHGASVAYASPIMYQKRNPHDLAVDFANEMPLYLGADSLARTVWHSAGMKDALNRLIDHEDIAEENLAAYAAFRKAAGLDK
jgi:hypothetical protein